MKIQDEAIILKKKKYGETSLLITFFSLGHGLATAIAKGVLKKDFGNYEIGNKVFIQCSFRLEEHLWNCKLDLIKNNSIIFFNEKKKLNTLLSICSILSLFLPEKLPYPKIYKKTNELIESLIDKDWIKKYIFWELFLLSELGYGLDLEKCTVTGTKKDLFYLSPKSGKAVTKDVGKKYENKLFILPDFFINKLSKIDNEQITKANEINSFFLSKFLKKVNNNHKHLPFYRKKIFE